MKRKGIETRQGAVFPAATGMGALPVPSLGVTEHVEADI